MLSRYCFICSSWGEFVLTPYTNGPGPDRHADGQESVEDRPRWRSRGGRPGHAGASYAKAGAIPQQCRDSRRPLVTMAQAGHTYQAPRDADMTKKIHVHLIDDLDASEASETVRFEVDGRNYEIDLSSRNAQKFRAEIAPFITHARRVITPARRRGRAGTGSA